MISMRIQSRFGDECIVFGKVTDELNVLVYRAGIVFHPREGRNQAAPQTGDLRLASVRRESRVVEESNLIRVKLLQPAIIACLGVSVSHGCKKFAVVRIVLKKLRQEIAPLL